MITSTEGLTKYLTTPYAQDPGTNNYKLLAAFYEGYWNETSNTNIPQLRDASHVPTQVGGQLDRWAGMLRILRRDGESDEAFRIRIAGAIRRLYGGVTVNDIIEFAAGVTGASRTNFSITENSPDGTIVPPVGYQPASYYLNFDPTILSALGFQPSEYAAVVQTLSDVITQVSAGGVQATVNIGGGGTYDVSKYDEATYGS